MYTGRSCSSHSSGRHGRWCSRTAVEARSRRRTRSRAFDNGLALGADGLELDVRLSRDGVVVVHHDARLDRTTNLEGEVSERTADELAHADAGCRFERDAERPFADRGIGVPTLAESWRDIRHADRDRNESE